MADFQCVFNYMKELVLMDGTMFNDTISEDGTDIESEMEPD